MLQSTLINYQKLEIEDKESYKWLLSAQQSQRCLACGGATMMTHIGDRESDLFEEFATVPNQYNHILVRVCQDRRLLDQSILLYEYLSQQPIEGTYIINVPADARTNRATREALVMVRRARVQIQFPSEEKFSLTSRHIRRSSRSVCANLAEA